MLASHDAYRPRADHGNLHGWLRPHRLYARTCARARAVSSGACVRLRLTPGCSCFLIWIGAQWVSLRPTFARFLDPGDAAESSWTTRPRLCFSLVFAQDSVDRL